MNGIAPKATVAENPTRTIVHRDGTTPNAAMEADIRNGAIPDATCFAAVDHPRSFP